ncbi:SLC13 family permease [Balneolales bacterium ANBcel1]|nr:SLC13 family permease [Balneolales bacterium ANBcel1]
MISEQIDWQAWFTAASIVTMIALLIQGRIRPHHLFLAVLLLLLVAGIITPVQAVSGFTSTAVLTVGALFVVAEGVRQAGLLTHLDKLLLSRKGGIGATLLRIMGSTSAMSSFLNNTPIVAMFTPQLQQWSGRIGIPVSKLLIPLSYAAIVGGTITLIGTSTNLIVSEMMSDRGHAPFGMFQLAWIGIPATILVIIWFATIGHRLLPDRENPAGAPAADYYEANEARVTRAGNRFFERRVFQGNFVFHNPLGDNNWPSGVYTTRYAMATGTSKTGANVPSGVYRSSNAKQEREQCVTWSNALPVLVIVTVMIGVSASGLLPVHWSVIGAALAILATGRLSLRRVIKAVHVPVLVVIACALGVGVAMEQTGLATVMAQSVVHQTSGFGVIAVLAGVYLITNLLTEMVTNNAAAVLMIPVALSASSALGMDPQAVGVTVAVAASASFLSPIGYQTNLMVMGPGGYRFTDFMKAGFPVTLILMAVTVGMVSWLWV